MTRVLVRLKRIHDSAHRRRIDRNKIRIAVHETHVAAIGTELRHVTRHQHAAVSRPMQHLEPLEVRAQADEREIVRQRMSLAVPKNHRRVGELHPLSVVFMQIDRNASESPAPFHHARVVVRMRDGNRCESTKTLDLFHGAVVDEADAIPEHSAVFRLQEQRPLADRKLRLRVDSPKLVALFEQDVVVFTAQVIERDPFLAVVIDVLPLIPTDRTARGRVLGRRKLCAASHADMSQGPRPPPNSMIDPKFGCEEEVDVFRD